MTKKNHARIIPHYRLARWRASRAGLPAHMAADAAHAGLLNAIRYYNPDGGKPPAAFVTLCVNSAIANALKRYSRDHHNHAVPLDTEREDSDNDNEALPPLQFPDPAPAPDCEIINAEERRRLRRAVDTLPQQEKRCIVAYFNLNGEQPTTQITLAAEQQCSRQTIQHRIRKGLKQLNKILGDDSQ